MLQPPILAPVPAFARYLTFQLVPEVDPRPALMRLAAMHVGCVDNLVVGIGGATARALGARVAGLREPTAHSGPGLTVPATPAALWCWIGGDAPGQVFGLGSGVEQTVAGTFDLDSAVDAYRFGDGRDLTGYLDGTENPTGDKAVAVAGGETGASFVAVQRWRHDFDRWREIDDQDSVIGRELDSNEELGDAPPSAHVKRTAQEDFEPEAFVVRRSMPWTRGSEAGLMFVAFGASFDAFEAQLRRMVGADDGITDALFRFTRPLTTGYFWCPPITEARKLDLSALAQPRS